MNFQRDLSDPFDIMSSFLSVHRSGAKYPFDPDEISKIARSIADCAKKKTEKPSDGYKDYLFDMAKENTDIAKKFHGLFKKWLFDYIESARDISKEDKQRAAFWAGQMVNACSPSNFFWTNLLAVKRCLDSDGKSLINGMTNWLDDIQDTDFMIKTSDPDAFRLGENLAYTPGKVVLQNELMELIQYKPSTQKTHSTPVLFIQPWINKYYIFDLTQDNSFVRYLRDQQFTVFIISWKNPGSQMRTVDFENYMLDGALESIEAAKDICRVKQIHAAGYCIGGTVLATLMAWLNRGFVPKRSLPVAHWTLFSTLVDFSNPGELGVFISQNIINKLESLMSRPGYLDKNYIGMVFRLLRSNSLIWQYYAHNYLQGCELPKSDVLFWNSDNTRLPEKMALVYLKEFYLNNKLSQKDGLQIGGRLIDLERIGQPLYTVGTQKDHISPWKETFKTCQLVKAETRYVVSTDGHIAGIVNPPSEHNRRKYRAGKVSPSDDPDTWFSNQTVCQGSWWPDWTDWLSQRCGPLVSPPSMGNQKYPIVGNAPGTYVMEA